MTLEDRVVLVTGSALAVGRAYARAIAKAGAKVVVADAFDDEGRETVALVEKGGGSAAFVHVDVTDEPSTVAAAHYAVETFGHLDVLVNNAATYRTAKYNTLTDLTVEQWDRTMAVFVRGAWLMSKAAIPLLEQSEHASIVNHTSVAAYGMANWFDYGAARGAVIAMTKSMAKELAPHIRVNALCVGGIGEEGEALGVVAERQATASSPEFQTRLIRRVGTGEDVAGAAVFLAGDASGYMTGQTICVDGGKYLLG